MLAIGGLRRQGHEKDSPQPAAIVLDAHRAAVQLDQVSDDCESEPEPPVLPRCAAETLAEPLEYVREKVGVDAGTRVANRDCDEIGVLGNIDVDAAAARRKAYGIRQQVPYDLLQAPRIARYHRTAAAGVDADLNLFRDRGGPNRVDSGADDVRNDDSLDVEPKLARHDARDVEQIVDQLGERVSVPLDSLDGARLL